MGFLSLSLSHGYTKDRVSYRVHKTMDDGVSFSLSLSLFLSLSHLSHLSRSLAFLLFMSSQPRRRRWWVPTRAVRTGNGGYKVPMGFHTHTYAHKHTHTHTHTYTHMHTGTHTHTRTDLSHAHKPTHSLSLSLTRTQTYTRIQHGRCSHFRCNSVRSKLLLLWVIHAYVKEPYMHTKKRPTCIRTRHTHNSHKVVLITCIYIDITLCIYV